MAFSGGVFSLLKNWAWYRQPHPKILSDMLAAEFAGIATALGAKQGVTDGGAAAAGYVGEIISSTIVNGSAIGLTSGAAKTITSIALTAGDWDVFINARFLSTATTVFDRMIASISLVNNTIDSTEDRRTDIFGGHTTTGLYVNPNALVGPAQFSLAAPATVYFIGYADFTASTCSVAGIIRARRVR